MQRRNPMNFKCIHFNGVQNETCRRGIPYQQFREGIAAKGFPGWLPCLSDDTDCPERRRQTAEEREAEDKEFEVVFARRLSRMWTGME